MNASAEKNANPYRSTAPHIGHWGGVSLLDPLRWRWRVAAGGDRKVEYTLLALPLRYSRA